MAAMAIGLVVSALCYSAIMAKGRFGYDDSLERFRRSLRGGAWGIFATGLSASTLINPAGADGLFCGGGRC